MLWVVLALGFCYDPGDEIMEATETLTETESTEIQVQEIDLDESKPVEVGSGRGSVIFSGRGAVIPKDGSTHVELETVILAEGAVVEATGLQITSFLTMALDTRLQAAPGQSLSIGENAAIQFLGSINFDDVTKSRFPFVDLGDVGKLSTTPSRLSFRAKLTGSDLDASQRVIIAKNLTNCEDWRRVVDFPINVALRTKCVAISEDETSLDIILAQDVPEPTKKPVEDGMIGGLVGGCGAVIILVVTAICFAGANVLRASSESSDSSSSSVSVSSSF